jgi:hypothetical protein
LRRAFFVHDPFAGSENILSMETAFRLSAVTHGEFDRRDNNQCCISLQNHGVDNASPEWHVVRLARSDGSEAFPGNWTGIFFV